MRVVLTGNYPLDDTKLHGGVQTAMTYLANGLLSIDNIEVHALTFKPINWSGPDRIEKNNLIIHLLNNYPRFERLRNYRVYQSILNTKLAEIQPDVVNAHEAGADAYVALRSGFPTVVTAHGIRCEDKKYYRTFGKLIRNNFDTYFIERPIMGQIKNLIAISHYVTDYFAPLFRSDLNVYYVPNAVKNVFFDLENHESQKIVLFAGRITLRKRVLDLIKAFGIVVQSFPDAQLRLAGEYNGDPSYLSEIRNSIRQAKLEKSVHLLGALSESMIMEEYARCSLLALPSAQETAPMVIAQAMAAGKPVVATRVGGVPEMVGDDESRGLLVNVGDIDELANSILKILQNPGLKDRMGQAGYIYALDNYHPHKVASQTYNVYNQVISSG